MNEQNEIIDEELEVLLIKHRFYSTVIKDILLTINAGALGGSFIQALCCIDYLGLAINPNWETHGKQDYKKYLHNFLGKIDTNYSKYSEEIYAVRCAFIHTYGKAKATNNKVIPSVRYNQSFICQHLSMADSKLEISVSQFIADLIVQ